MQIKFDNNITQNTECLVITVGEDLNLIGLAQEINQNLNNIISDAIEFENFKGKRGDVFQVFGNHKNLPKLILVFGYGKASEIDDNKIITLGGRISSHLNNLKIKSAHIIADFNKTDIDYASLIAQGMMLRNYKFNKYRTKDKNEHQLFLENISITSDDFENSEKNCKLSQNIAEGVYLARNLVSEPPNILYPESYAERIMELSKYGVKVIILGEDELKELGMGALLGVGQGSKKESKVVIMEYKNNSNNDKYDLGLVGKGVTFDTGGISIKPANGMEDMKQDMAGSAVIVGLMKTLALKGAKVNVVGVVGLVENMPGDNAQRPSDIVTSMSGQTIEVLNTDAEGRLVLADVLWYCQDKYKPQYMIDLATLTGAITVTFGQIYAGLFSNNDELADRLVSASQECDEKIWRLPMGDVYDKMLNSEIADMQNISMERGAGSIIAAQFLKRFINDANWAHLDIAGVSWNKKDSDITPKGATGFGVRLLHRFIEENIEK